MILTKRFDCTVEDLDSVVVELAREYWIATKGENKYGEDVYV